jgi:hypothetical protein
MEVTEPSLRTPFDIELPRPFTFSASELSPRRLTKGSRPA